MRAPWLIRTSSLYFHKARALRHTGALLRYNARSLCHRYERAQFTILFIKEIKKLVPRALSSLRLVFLRTSLVFLKIVITQQCTRRVFYFFSTPCSQSLHGVESLCRSPVLKLIHRKKKLSYNFFLTFLTMSVSKNIIKKIGQRVYCRDMMSQIYPVDACTYTNHARYVMGSRYILR